MPDWVERMRKAGFTGRGGTGDDLPEEPEVAFTLPAVIHSDPEILGGTPVFVGTRVPGQHLIDYLDGGHPLEDFLDDFPTVTREQAETAAEDLRLDR